MKASLPLAILVIGLLLPASTTVIAEEPATDAAAQFQPGEISIGEPLQLPARRAAEQPAILPRETIPTEAGQPAQASSDAGNGWIGLTVDDKVVTGRLVVVDIASGGPADLAGIRVHDQLLGINGAPLRTADQLAAALAAIAPGDTVKVAVGREDRIDEASLKATARPAKPASPAWQKKTVTDGAPLQREAPVAAASPGPVRPTPPPAFTPAPAIPAPAPTPDASAAALGKGRTALGVRTMPVDESVAARFNLTQPAGALVIGVVHDLPASKAGVPPGSVIVALDDRPVRSPDELTEIVTRGPVGRPVTLQYILPGGEQRRAEVSLQSLEVPLERALVGPER